MNKLTILPYDEFIKASIPDLQRYISVAKTALVECEAMLGLHPSLQVKHDMDVNIIKENINRAELVMETKVITPFEITSAQLN